MGFITLSIVLVLAVSWFLVPHALRKSQEQKLRIKCEKNRFIVLSYDDGPGPDLTPRILDLLEGADIQATFFLLGRNAVENADLVTRLNKGGHDVGTHTFNHTNAWKSPPWQAARDLEQGRNAMVPLGADPRLFRPPFGKLTLAGLVHGKWRGLRYGWWTIDSNDTSKSQPSAQAVLDTLRRQKGGVVLLHDFDREGSGKKASRAEYVVDLTREILALAAKENFQIVPLSRLID